MIPVRFGSTASPDASTIGVDRSTNNRCQALIEDPTLSLGALPVLSLGDLDGDGLVDLVAGNDAGHFLFVRNIGTKDETRYDSPVRLEAGGKIFKVDAGYTGIQGPPESRWGYTCPTVYRLEPRRLA